MAFINLKTFDILEKEGPEEAFREGYFECDEEIAGVVLLLNKKGYRTLFSCSGHLYDEISDTLEEENTAFTEEALRELYPGILAIRTAEDGVRTLILRQNLSLKSYIVFAPEILLPSVPEEWRLDGRVLSHNYYWDSAFGEIRDLNDLKSKPFVFYRRRAELLSILYDWAQSLPDYDPAAREDPDSGLRQANENMERMRQTYRNGPLL
ncbi:MAG: hypothetical protein IKR59_05230 [Lachnospiraceae bacterium]|nr:hypothetical protein [Lachnospiraceae bacterium]